MSLEDDMEDYLYRQDTERRFTEEVGKVYLILDTKSNAIISFTFLDKVSAENALEHATTLWPEAELSIMRLPIVTFPKVGKHRRRR